MRRRRDHHQTWTLTDDCGNTTTHVQIITVRGQHAPTFTVPADITIYKDATCSYDASVSITGDVTDEADNCDTSLDATFTDVVVAGCMRRRTDHHQDLDPDR